MIVGSGGFCGLLPLFPDCVLVGSALRIFLRVRIIKIYMYITQNIKVYKGSRKKKFFSSWPGH